MPGTVLGRSSSRPVVEASAVLARARWYNRYHNRCRGRCRRPPSPGGRLLGHGRLGLDPLASTGTVSVEGLEPGRFAGYYGDQVAFRVDGGPLSFGTSYELGERREPLALHLREGFVTIRDLALRRPGARSAFLRLPQLAARAIDVDLDRRTGPPGADGERPRRGPFLSGERARLLAAAHQAATFAKPRNFLGLAKSLPPDEMERLLMVQIELREEHLRALAARRASVVKEALDTAAPTVAGRLFVVNPFLIGGTSVEIKLRTE